MGMLILPGMVPVDCSSEGSRTSIRIVLGVEVEDEERCDFTWGC